MSIALVAGCLALSLAGLGSTGKSHPEGFLAQPKSGHGRGVLVLHAWWGLNADVKALCNRLANSGFVAFAPDLFHGQIATTVAEAEGLVKAHQSKEAEINSQIGEAAKFLGEASGKPEIGVIGLSFGAYYALAYSNSEPARAHAVVVFYGTGADDFTKSKAAYLGHFAEKDDFEPKASVDGLKKLLKDAGRSATIYTYPGTGHWFFEPSVKGSYKEAASKLAWTRTLKFLQENLPAKND